MNLPSAACLALLAGGATDVIGRILARGLQPRLGQTVVVDNRAGAGTTIGAVALQHAPPDGHTIFFSSSTTYTINPSIRSNLPYDAQKFSPVGVVGTIPLALIAHPGFVAQDVRQLVAMAKAKPGGIAYASFGAGTSSHFAGEMFKQAAGIDLMHVPYKGSSPAMQDLIAGQVPLAVDTVVAAQPQAATARIRILAVTSPKRLAALPTVPTVAESGYPGFAIEPWGAVVAPPGTAPAALQVLTRALAQTVADPVVRAELQKAGMDVAWEPPPAYHARLAQELPALRALVHKAKIVAE